MAYVITEACIDELSQNCVDVCPVDCIHYDAGVDRKLYIDPDGCIDCGACEPECPVNAIFPAGKLPIPLREYALLDARWYKKPDAARARIDELKSA